MSDLGLFRETRIKILNQIGILLYFSFLRPLFDSSSLLNGTVNTQETVLPNTRTPEEEALLRIPIGKDMTSYISHFSLEI
jgi:hypothetical protein